MLVIKLLTGVIATHQITKRICPEAMITRYASFVIALVSPEKEIAFKGTKFDQTITETLTLTNLSKTNVIYYFILY